MFLRIINTFVLTLLLGISSLAAQQMVFSLIEDSELSIEGTSNVRDWDADATSMSADLRLSGMDEFHLDSLSEDSFLSLRFTVPVQSLESDSGGLTKNIHKYLDGKNHPVISFQLTNIESIEREGDEALITASGTLSAAGVEKPVNMQVNAIITDNGDLQFSGTTELKMTTFDIDPPRAMLGTIRARDEFNVRFNVRFTTS